MTATLAEERRRLSWEAQQRAFPHDDLDGCKTALLLFGAAFLGWNDGWHVANAGVLGTVIDTDHDRILEMQALYPQLWTFVTMDAFKAARSYQSAGVTFDLVSVDPFTNYCDEIFRLIPLWTSIARRQVLLTITRDQFHGIARGARPPDGWRALPPVERSTTGVYWYRLQKENRAA